MKPDAPRYEARVAHQPREDRSRSATHSATAVDERSPENTRRDPEHRASWNPAPVLDPLAELYRR